MRELGRGPVGRERLWGRAALVAGRAELELHLGTARGIVDAERERPAQQAGRVLEGQARGGIGRGEQRVAHRAAGIAEHGGGPEVVGQVGGGCVRARLQGLADRQVQHRAPVGRQAVVERAPHELVREAPAQLVTGKLLHHAAARRLLERLGQHRRVELAAAPQQVEAEFGTGDGGQLEHAGRACVEPAEALRDDLAHALGGRDRLERPRELETPARARDRAGLDQRLPQLAEQEGVAAGQAAERGGERPGVVVARGSRGALEELADLVGREAGQPQAQHVSLAPQLGEGVGELRGHVGLGVAEGGDDEQARVDAVAGEVPQQEQRGAIRPVAVLEHDDERPAAAERREQLADGAVQPVALGVLVRAHGGAERACVGREIRQDPRQLPAAGAEVGAQALGRQLAHGPVERLDERPERGRDDGVARTVEHGRARIVRAPRELAHEPALARPRLAADQDQPALLRGRPREQPVERLELRLPADERQRRLGSQRAGQRRRRLQGHDQD